MQQRRYGAGDGPETGERDGLDCTDTISRAIHLRFVIALRQFLGGNVATYSRLRSIHLSSA